MNPDPGQDTETKKLKWFVFWFSRDDPTGHKRKNKKRETEEEGGGGRGKTILKSGREWTLPAQLGQLKTGKSGMEKDCCEVLCQRLWDRRE